MWLQIVYLAVILMSAMVGFFHRKYIRSRNLILLPYYLLYVFTQETTSTILSYANLIESNGLMYNIYNPLIPVFFSFLFTNIPFNRSSKKWIMGLLMVYLVAVAVTYLFIQPIHIYNNYVFLVGSVLTTLNAIVFLFNYFKLDNRTEEKKWQPLLWVVIGVVTFYPVVNIAFSFYKFLVAYDAKLWGMRLYRMIPHIMSIFMYSCFARAFYLCKKKS